MISFSRSAILPPTPVQWTGMRAVKSPALTSLRTPSSTSGSKVSSAAGAGFVGMDPRIRRSESRTRPLRRRSGRGTWRYHKPLHVPDAVSEGRRPPAAGALTGNAVPVLIRVGTTTYQRGADSIGRDPSSAQGVANGAECKDMEPRRDHAGGHPFRRVVWISSLSVILVAAVVLIGGWMLDVRALRTIIPGAVGMKAPTAFMLALWRDRAITAGSGTPDGGDEMARAA